MIRPSLSMACALLGALLLASPVLAQGFNMAQSDQSEIQVYADQGMEWHSESNRVIAQGNAKAIRGRMTVTADRLTAYYRKGASGDEIWRLDADGDVTIFTPTERATGTKAIYDLDKALFILIGAPAKLVTPKETFTANEQLEYWEKDRMAVGRGGAKAEQGTRTISAETLTGYFKDGPNGGGLELKRADAFGNVVLISPTEKVTGDKGDYNAETGIATVLGSVKITRDGNTLDGGFAHVNLRTGVSKLSPVGGGGRVQGVFMPEQQNKGGPTPSPRAGAGAAAPGQ